MPRIRIPGALLILCLAATQASAGPISFAYNFATPNLGANQSITQLDVGITVQSSALGKGAKLEKPTLATKLVPNPFIMPTPDCIKTPEDCSPEPVTINGVDPKGKNPTDPQFFFDSSKFAATPGIPTDINLMKPGAR